jgi:eukaryotic-like serine/threonine-protein kinase
MPKQNPEEAAEIAPGTVIDGRYKVVRCIGQGGNGMVYEVEHTRTGRRLALKALLDETGFARLEQEARAASLMKNGHTARIIDMESGGPAGAYLVMELLEGQNLRALLDDAGQLPLELTVNMAMQVCECLQESHGLGVIHRDLKPENVFLCASPWPGQYDVKVLDFGVMKISNDGGAIPKSSLTRTGSTVGTPYYMSLEQLRNSSAVDARADVYSLGVVLYECLSGRKPYQADTIGDLVYALCSGPPTQLSRLRPDLPADMAEVVMRTLNANRDDRPATMLDLALALLPHANQAFALWVKVDGKQPALSRTPSGTLDMRGAPPAAAQPAIAPPRVAAGAGGRAPVRPGLSPSPAAAAPAPAPPVRPADMPSERRDTPTEMYVKGTHGVELPDEREGDRDTPTRALVLEGMFPPALATLQSPQGIVEDANGDVSTFKLADGAQFVPPAQSGHAGGMLSPSASTAKLTIPLGDMYRMPTGTGGPVVGGPMPGGPIAAPVTPPPSAPPGSFQVPPKPGWQAALDGALIGIGRGSERQMKRFREAPQNTQIIVLIVIGTAVIMVMGLVLFLALH